MMVIKEKESYEDMNLIEWMDVVGYPPAFICFMTAVIAALTYLLSLTDFMEGSVVRGPVVVLVVMYWVCMFFILWQWEEYLKVNRNAKKVKSQTFGDGT